jgi:hypothetical protein
MKWTETEFCFILDAGPIIEVAFLNKYNVAEYGATPGNPVYSVDIFPNCKLARGEKSTKKKSYLAGFHSLEQAKLIAEEEVKHILENALKSDL